jgi:hypothetical protein
MNWTGLALKLVPHLKDVALAFIPVFTHPKVNKTSAPDVANEAYRKMREQIIELQSAATQNSELIRKLAEDLGIVISSLAEGEKTIDQQFRRLELLAYGSLAISILSLTGAAILLVQRH